MQLFSRGAIAGAALVAAATLATFAAAQDTQAPTPPPGQQRRGAGAPGEPAAAANQQPQRQLPADSVTQHSVELPGRTLKFSATAGSIAMRNAEGRLTAEIAYIAYTLTDAEAKTRPVTFALNGGPGSASAWVHLGGFGPWRVAMDGAAISPSAQPALLPNAETWLDFTDLVFVDPVGTGFSRVARSTGGEGGAGAGANPNAPQSGPQANRGGGFYSVNGDVDSLAEMIHLWLRKHNRIASPKMLVGESYSGIRAPKIVYQLQTKYGAGFNAMVMLSPVLDYGMIRNNRNQPMAPVIMLPSIAAAAKEAKGEKLSRSGMAEIETYARGEFLADLLWRSDFRFHIEWAR